MTKKFLYIFLIASVYGINVMAQHISEAMQFVKPVKERDSTRLSLSYSNLFYFRDYEYFNNIQTGYTLFGTWHDPRISYQPSKWLRLEAGVLLQKEFGDKKLDKAWPIFSLHLQKKDIRLLF